MLLSVDCMCQCGLHAVPWSHIGILIRPLVAEPRSTANFCFPLGVGLAGFKSRANALILPTLSLLYSLILFFPFSSFCPQVGIVVLWSSD